MNAGLLRYSAVDWLRSQRWLPPTLMLVIMLSVLYATGGGTVATYGVTASLLFPLSAWLVIGALNSEDEEQRWVTAVAAGGILRVVVARVLVAVLWSLLLAVVAVGWSLLADDPARKAADVLVGLVAHVLCALAGAGLGVVVARPLVYAPGYAALAVIIVFVLELALQFLPPVGPTVVLLTGDDPRDPAALAAIAVETVVLFGVVTAIGLWLTRRLGA